MYSNSNTMYNLDTMYSLDIMKKFYRSLQFTKFNSLSLERMQELDREILALKNRFSSIYTNKMTIMCSTASKLTTSAKTLGLNNSDEIAYFYIKIVDKHLLFLELTTLAQNKDELKEVCKKQFGVYDGIIIYMEKCLENRLKAIKLEQEEHIVR